MPILIIEQHGAQKAGVLSGRVLIGRWSDNTVVVSDRGVSRIHAWIGLQKNSYYVSDAGSRTGTFVNDSLLRTRHTLVAGDQIHIGPAVLTFQDDPLPTGVEEIDLTPRPAAALSSASGKFMECTCGAPLWLPTEYAGSPRCRYCGHSVKRLAKKIPAEALAPARVPTIRHDVERVCGICHSPITAVDQVTDCGSCGLPFHAECWIENHGCSAYGCDQVGALDRRNAG
jgi:hypothetical protein